MIPIVLSTFDQCNPGGDVNFGLKMDAKPVIGTRPAERLGKGVAGNARRDPPSSPSISMQAARRDERGSKMKVSGSRSAKIHPAPILERMERLPNDQRESAFRSTLP